MSHPKLTIVVLAQTLPSEGGLAATHERMLRQIEELRAGLGDGVTFVSRPVILKGAYGLLRSASEAPRLEDLLTGVTEAFHAWLDRSVAPCLHGFVPDADKVLAAARIPVLSVTAMERAVIDLVERYHAAFEQRFGCLLGPWLRLDPRTGRMVWIENGLVASVLDDGVFSRLISGATLEHVPWSGQAPERTLLPWLDHSVLQLVAEVVEDDVAEAVVCDYSGLPPRQPLSVLPAGMPVRHHVFKR